jgi:hypothetical protein
MQHTVHELKRFGWYACKNSKYWHVKNQNFNMQM